MKMTQMTLNIDPIGIEFHINHPIGKAFHINQLFPIDKNYRYHNSQKYNTKHKQTCKFCNLKKKSSPRPSFKHLK